ncbi:MAG TPA: hypothetical protein ENH32_06245 [Proteobacteria bacterium]|nr:hypothetical protein BMS3Abin14_02177 [bacterium BMS3Abin14]HDL53558.1 hypothetical protein [Pseudomonadota bacterium]
MGGPYKKTPLADLDFSGLKTYSVFTRDCKVTSGELGVPYPGNSYLSDFVNGLPKILASRDLQEVAGSIVRARREERGVLLGMGAHPLKVGMGPIISDAMETGILTGIATNGAAIIHDYELALLGKTSEDVGAALSSGLFGMAEETAVGLNGAIRAGAEADEGIGLAVGRFIEDGMLLHAHSSIFATAYRCAIPATVHVAIGTDIIHMHPSCDGASTGAGTLKDFRLFARQVAALDDGVFINLGSAVIIPEIFLKAFSLARNLGNPIANLTTVNMDFVQHYRPRVNVVQRPTSESGKGYSIIGHHEIMLPLLLAAVKELM